MFSCLMKLLVIRSTILNSNTDNEKDLIIKRFIIAFDDKALLKNWLEDGDIKCSTAIEVFKNITRKVRDILSVLNNKEFSLLKSMILETNIVLTRIGYLYYETICVFKSLKRILTINDEINKTKHKTHDKLRELFFKEYDMIYNMLESTIIHFDDNLYPKIKFGNYMEWTDKKCERKTNSKETICDENNSESMFHLLGYANCLFESVLPNEINSSLFFQANYKGFAQSIKCKDDAKYLFLREKTSMVYSEFLFSYSIETSDNLNLSKTDVKKYMNKIFLCDKTFTKELIKFFHCWSETTKTNTIYEITLKEDKKYQIKWSFLKNPSVKEIKKYWMEQEVTNFSKFKISSIIELIRINNEEYSIYKSYDVKKKPLRTRLIVLSCGDLLGGELIDDFLENYYMKFNSSLDCPYCNLPTSILGSFDTIVYRLKQNTPCIIS